jgi:hypothetical protein
MEGELKDKVVAPLEAGNVQLGASNIAHWVAELVLVELNIHM